MTSMKSAVTRHMSQSHVRLVEAPQDIACSRLHQWHAMCVASGAEPRCTADVGVFPRPTPELISDFESKSDLVRCHSC